MHYNYTNTIIYIYIYIYIIVIIILLDIITNLTNQRKKYSDLIFLKVMNYDIENTFEKYISLFL